MTLSGDDRDLLFGEIAVRSGVLSADDLRSAETVWRQQAESTLGDFLVSRAVLNAPERDALESLVDARLRRESSSGEGAASESVSEYAIGTLPPGADVSTAGGGEAAAKPRAGDERPFGAETSGDRFRVIREHARGGLGVVSLARDSELNREVALKEIRSELSSGRENQRRFLAEAEITGGLEHPGVVPVYGLGRDASGRPYYAMRFIRGESLGAVARRFHAAPAEPSTDSPGVAEAGAGEGGGGARKANRHELAFRKLCRRFVDVCNVIEYAHNRAVVHRDLKPENIMLGDYGETIVVDWGLAKSIEAGDDSESEHRLSPLRSVAAEEVAASTAGKVVGTPAFMSPEQALGWVDKVGPAADIYGLGATLYYILTGRAPFSADASGGISDMLARVIEGRFEPPRQINRRVPKPLAAICRKAMAVKPHDRYRSARALADDVENWLADEPVAAYAEPLPERLSRWSRKHRALTAGLAVLLVTGIIGLSIGMGAVKQEQARTEEKRTEAVAARKEADRQASLARQNASHARSQNRLALDTLDSVVFDIQRSLQSVPGAGRIRKRLLQTAITKLGQVARGLETAPEADRDLGVAYLDLGDVFLRIGSEPGLSATKEADRLYRKAADVFQKLEAAGATDPRVAFGQAAAWMKIGDVTMRRGQLNRAGDAYRKASTILAGSELVPLDAKEHARHVSTLREKLGNVAREKGDLKAAEKLYAEKLRHDLKAIENGEIDVERLRSLAIAYDRMALLHQRSGKLADAEAAYLKSTDLRRRIVAAQPQDGLAKRDYIVSQINLGDIAEERGEFQTALKTYKNALAAARELQSAAPDDRAILRDVSILCERAGDVSRRLDDDESATKYLNEKLAIDRKLAAGDSGDARARRDLSLSYERLGDAALAANRTNEALAHFRKKLAMNEALSRANPNHVDDRRNLGIAHSKLGEALRQSGDLPAATKSIERCYAIGEELVSRSPADQKLQQDFAYYCGQLAAVRLAAGEFVDAGRLYRKKLEIDRKLVDADPKNASRKRQLAIACDGLGEIARLSRQNQQALMHFREALSLRRSLAGETSNSNPAARELMVSLNNVGKAAYLLNDAATAERHFKEAFGIATKRLADRPDDADRRFDLSNVCRSMGDVLRKRGDLPNAKKYYEQKLELDTALVRAFPKSIPYQRGLAIGHDMLGDLHFELRDGSAAAAAYRECLKLRKQIVADSPGNAQLVADLTVSYAKLGNLANKQHRYAAAIEWWKKALAALNQLGPAGKQQPLIRARLKLFDQQLRRSTYFLKCADDLQFTLSQSPELVAELLGIRGAALAARGEPAAAEKTAELLAARKSDAAKSRYQAARVYARCAAAVRKANGSKPAPAKSQKQLKQYADRALKLLQSAEREKYFSDRAAAARFLKSWDFAPLSALPEYKELSKRVAAAQSPRKG